MRLTGVIRNGKRVYDIPAAPVIAAQDIGEGKRFVETIEVERNTRSDRANRRWWGVVIPLVQHALSKTRDVPLSKEQAHYVAVAAFAGCDITELGPVPVKTSQMDSKQFALLSERTEAWLADQGYYIPEPGEAA